MFIEWSEQLEIGDPVVDSEHRYLVQLIVNLHEQYEQGKVPASLAKVFSYLAMYVKTHFENEEKLMEAIAYPGLEEHRQQHRSLVAQAIELSEKYMDGSETITDETTTFLKEWALNHIAESDIKIRSFLQGQRPPALNSIPAFAISSGDEFKKCTVCGKVWQTFQGLLDDDGIKLKGCQLDMTNHLYNLVLFDCSCGTTLGMFIKELMTKTDIEFVINEQGDNSQRPGYCLKRGGDACLAKCACAYTSEILDAIGKGERGKVVE